MRKVGALFLFLLLATTLGGCECEKEREIFPVPGCQYQIDGGVLFVREWGLPGKVEAIHRKADCPRQLSGHLVRVAGRPGWTPIGIPLIEIEGVAEGGALFRGNVLGWGGKSRNFDAKFLGFFSQ